MKRGGSGGNSSNSNSNIMSIRDFMDFNSDSSSSSPSSSQSPNYDDDDRRENGYDDSDEDLEIMIKNRRKRRKRFGEDDDDGNGGSNARYKRPIAFVKKGLAADEVLEHEYDDNDDNNKDDEEYDTNNDTRYDAEQNFSYGGRGGLGFSQKNKGPDTRKNYSNFLDINSSGNGGKDAFDSVYGKGSKILKSMGWNTGEGLGKERDGIAEPIQVKLRPKGRGLGCGVDEKTEQQKRLEQQQQQQQQKRSANAASPSASATAALEDKKGTEYASLPDAEKLWKKGGKKRRKDGPKYIVVDDGGYDSNYGAYIAGDDEGYGGTHRREIVTDMRGPHARIVGSVAEALRIGKEEEEEEEEAAADLGNPLLPLQHNVQLLANMARDKMQANSRRASEAGTTLSALERSVAREAQTLEATRSAVQRLRELRAAVARVGQLRVGGGGNARALCGALRALKAEFPEEWARFNFDGLALGMSRPALVERLELWNPLTDPTDYLDEFDEWKQLFKPAADRGANDYSDDNANASDDDNDGFSNMLAEVFLPRVREAALRWSARDYEPMTNFFVLWAPVLTRTIRDYITANIILPRLQDEVGAWDPRTDPVAVHLWLHPWLPVLGDAALEPLWAPVRQKMGSALAAWQPADPSAHAILAPWAPVFGEAGMAALLGRCVVPKLAAELRKHEVAAGPLGADPQQLPRAELVARLGAKPFVWAAGWADLLGPDAAAQLLEADFFPSWARALLAWVGGGKVDTEVGWWYQGWKLLFPEVLVRHKAVQRYFKYALDLMACALAGKPFPPLPAPATSAFVGASGKAQQQQQQPSALRSGGTFSRWDEGGAPGLTLREVLEQLAGKTNILFTPTNKTHGGKDVYKFGTTSVIMDSKLVYAHTPETGKWDTITLDELVRRNSTKPEYDDVE